MDFDFGDLDFGLRWLKDSYPSEGEKVLLLDADYIPYTVGFCSKPEEYQDYLDGKYNLDNKKDHACFLIHDAMTKAGADAVTLFFTCKPNFRDRLGIEYKGNRADKEKPAFFNEIRQWMEEQFYDNVVYSVDNEADDMISIYANELYDHMDREDVPRTPEMYKMWCPYIIGSKDKDLRQVFGWHVDLKTGEHFFVSKIGSLEPKFKETMVKEYGMVATGQVYVRGAKKGQPKMKKAVIGCKIHHEIKSLKGTGARFFYAQMLMGDPTDGYYGLAGVGCGRAYQMLKDCLTVKELHEVVSNAYMAEYGSNWYGHFLTQGRMAYMQQSQKELWDGGYEQWL